MALSRDELEAIIQRGESVMLPDGRCVTTVDALPSAVELAGNDVVKKQHAIGDLKAMRALLEQQIADAESQPSQEGKPEDLGGNENLSTQAFNGAGLEGFALELAQIIPVAQAKVLVEADFNSKEALQSFFENPNGMSLPQSVSKTSEDKLRDYVRPTANSGMTAPSP